MKEEDTIKALKEFQKLNEHDQKEVLNLMRFKNKLKEEKRKTLCQEEYKNCEIVIENQQLKEIIEKAKRYIISKTARKKIFCKYDNFHNKPSIFGNLENYQIEKLLDILNGDDK